MISPFQVLVAVALASAGYAMSFSLSMPWSQISLWGGIYASLLCLAVKRRRVILKLGSLSWTEQELCRHVLITGDTGSGKTTCGLHPILVQLTRNVPGWGGLVLGVKGDEHRFVTELARHHGRDGDVIHLQVRPEQESTSWRPPHRYNLVSDRGLPWMTHAKAIVDIAASLTEGSQSAFFRPMAQIALAMAFELLDEIGEVVTITRAYRLLSSTELVVEALKALDKLSPTPGRLELGQFFRSTFTEAKAFEQREGIQGSIKTYLGFFIDPDIAAVFSSDEPNTLSISDVDHGAILSVTMPQRFVSQRRYVQTYLKMLFYYHALRRFDRPESPRNLLLLVADEFQDIVTASEDGISDHKIVDRVRSAGLAIIAAMQSEISIDPTIGRDKRKVLALNMRSRLIFRAADIDGADTSAQFIGKKRIWRRSKTGRPFGPVTITKREDQEFRVKPSFLMQLRDRHAVIVHPSKRFLCRRLKPLDGRGRVCQWHR